ESTRACYLPTRALRNGQSGTADRVELSPLTPTPEPNRHAPLPGRLGAGGSWRPGSRRLEEGGRPLMVIRTTALALSFAIIGGCAMKAPRVPAPLQDGAIADFGPNSPWQPDYGWLGSDSIAALKPAGQEQLAKLLS